MKFRVKDYVIFYVLSVGYYFFEFPKPIKSGSILGIFIGALLPALIIGSLTNLFWGKARKK